MKYIEGLLFLMLFTDHKLCEAKYKTIGHCDCGEAHERPKKESFSPLFESQNIEREGEDE